MYRCYSGSEVYYLFIFNSGMECRTLFQRCGRLYFPMFLFRSGLFTLVYMASLMVLAILCPSPSMILKFSTDVVWPVLFWCSKMGDGAFKCFLYPTGGQCTKGLWAGQDTQEGCPPEAHCIWYRLCHIWDC